ncbi:hypothetical protein SCP_0303900 [Sparassis crispa]|uniref:Uncharacterized protein n=1 Tax=Sparassis crispa TaxID=139825 RepID=A0A401GEV4_9APHY|nr:hypothetical protein SCP_0303900 [Sparassis crispa]GBE80671.1 hypothetical protein SCP_0303900 [Sparassis crispa]
MHFRVVPLFAVLALCALKAQPAGSRAVALASREGPEDHEAPYPDVAERRGSLSCEYMLLLFVSHL